MFARIRVMMFAWIALFATAFPVRAELPVKQVLIQVQLAELNHLAPDPFFWALDNSLQVTSGDPLRPYSNPGFPHPGSVLSIPIPDSFSTLKIRPMVVLTPRGIAEGLVLFEEFDGEDFTITSLRVKGRGRGLFDIRHTVDNFQSWWEEDTPSDVETTKGWNIRLALAGRGGLDNDRDTPLTDLFQSLPPSYLDLADSAFRLDRTDRFRFRGASNNRVTFNSIYGPQNDFFTELETPQRLGNRKYQLTGPIDFVHRSHRYPREEAGLDLRLHPWTYVDSGYDSSIFDIVRAPTYDSGRLVARTGHFADRYIPTYPNTTIVRHDEDGQGTINVNAATYENYYIRPGSLATKHQVPGDRGVRYRVQARDYVFNNTSHLTSLYENEIGDKPANFLDVNALDLWDRQRVISGGQVRIREQTRYLGIQGVFVPPPM